MSTVIRVKRRFDEEPLEAFVVNCKKFKLDNDQSNNEVSSVFKLAATIKNDEEDILKHIKTNKQDAYKGHAVNLTDKIRDDIITNSKNNRYKVLNYYRSKTTEDAESSTSTDDNNVTIVDIEENLNSIESLKQAETSYVYDLYYTNSDDFGEANLDDYINVYPLSDELVFGSARDNGGNESSDTESEDSNAESNWKNDYPDESDVESVTKEDMVKAVKRITIEDDLSSDDGEEGFVYSIDSEAAGFEEDIDETDVRRYGEMYARFKARHKHTDKEESKSNLYFGDIDENEYYY